MLETERLILRHWEDSDAESLYKYAKVRLQAGRHIRVWRRARV